jgi:hypothetical protein
LARGTKKSQSVRAPANPAKSTGRKRRASAAGRPVENCTRLGTPLDFVLGSTYATALGVTVFVFSRTSKKNRVSSSPDAVGKNCTRLGTPLDSARGDYVLIRSGVRTYLSAVLFGGRPDTSVPDSEKLCLFKEDERICPPVVKGDASRFLGRRGSQYCQYGILLLGDRTSLEHHLCFENEVNPTWSSASGFLFSRRSSTVSTSLRVLLRGNNPVFCRNQAMTIPERVLRLSKKNQTGVTVHTVTLKTSCFRHHL